MAHEHQRRLRGTGGRRLVLLACLAGCHLALPYEHAGQPRDATLPVLLDGAPLPDALTDAGALPDGVVRPALGVAGGLSHACALRGGALFCWGDNAFGQLGAGDQLLRRSPAPVESSTGWLQLAPSVQASFSCALADDGAGTLLCWGDNQHGQLGLGDLLARSVPTVLALRGWQAVSRGQDHACGLRDGGALHCWGRNFERRLGLGDEEPRLIPTAVAPAERFLAVSAGDGHTVAVRGDGSLWGWGRNTSSELGLGPGAPIQLPTPTRIGTDADWADVAASQLQTCARKRDNSLWCWGRNSSGQLGVGDTAHRDAPTQVAPGTRWRSVALSWFHACGLQLDGSLWCWGRNEEGQLGLGDSPWRTAPARVDHATWAAVALSRFATHAQRPDGAVYCTGSNREGQLGTGDAPGRVYLEPLRF